MASTSDNFRAHMGSLRAKKRMKAQIEDNLTGIRAATICSVNQADIEAVLCVKHGLAPVAQLQSAVKRIPPIISASYKNMLLEVTFKVLGLEYSIEEQNVIAEALLLPRDHGNVNTVEENVFLSPPVEKCLKCNSHLSCHNKPSEVTVYKLSGPTKALNICWKCVKCNINYNYCRFGNSDDGYHFYEEERPYIQATHCTFLDRQLCRYQIFLGYVLCEGKCLLKLNEI
jgi:hypothetical protein